MLTSSLVSASWLAAAAEEVVVLDVRAGAAGRQAYQESHLAGARWVDLETDLAATGQEAADGGRHPLPALEDWCRRLGEWEIGPQTDVVLYDDSGGAMAAARAWWMIRAVGHDRVALLDGGFNAAVAAGLALDSAPLESAEAAALPARVDYPCPTGGWVLPIADADEVEFRRLSRDSVVVDVRSAVRYRGEKENLDPIAGHIPGAVNDPYESNLDEEGRFQPAEKLRARLEGVLREAGSDNAVVYCGSGVTACHTLLALHIAGLEGAALYVGSWSEWCRSERPRASIHSD